MTVFDASILQFFSYNHLKPEMQAVSKPFCDLARYVAESIPASDERKKALDALLVAKDAAVRASIYKADWKP